MAEEAPPKDHRTPTPTSTSDLMASAKTVAEAAQLACAQQTDKIDKAKVAGAAEDILEAAKSYGKLDENSGVGQYVGKAEDYLHKLHSSSEPAATGAAEGGEKEKAAPKEESGGGGVEDVLNVAKKGLGGFFS